MAICPSCGKEMGLREKVGRQEVCPHCRSDVHCCIHCTLYDEYAQNKCREPSSEWVSDREQNNFCEYFELQGGSAVNRSVRDREEARAKLEALFKKKN